MCHKHAFLKFTNVLNFNINNVLSMSLQALEVSDHFPVEVDLKPNHRYLLRNEL